MSFRRLLRRPLHTRHQQTLVANRRAKFRPAIQALEDRLALAASVVGYKFLDINDDGIRNTNIIQGNRPDIVFVVDVSSSTAVGPGAIFVGSPIGDINADGVENTILDAELRGFQALTQQLLDQGLGDDADVGILLFGGNAVQLDVDLFSPGDQLTIPAGRDANGNTVPDVIELLSLIRHGGQGLSAGVNGATTNYEAALQQTIQFFNTLGTAPGSGNMVFLTDGQPNDPSTSTAVYADEVNTLRSMNVNLRAYGAGGTSAVPPLRVIDASAVRFESTDELFAAFGGLEGPKTVFTEPGIAGVKIWIDIDRDGLFDADEPFTFTIPDNLATPENELGNYIIAGLPNGTYDVHEDVPPGMIQTAPSTGYGTIDVTGNFNYRVNFGNRPGEISGIKWLDENGNGIRDQLIVGDSPTVIFVVDVSGSTQNVFQGTVAIGDLNSDGLSNTILDSEIAGFVALNESLINGGFGAVGSVAIIAFDTNAFSIDMDPVTPGVQLSINPLADRDNNGIRDVEQALSTLALAGTTNYEAALSLSLSVFSALGTPSSQANLVFLSDGAPDFAGAHTDEVAALRTAGYNNLRAFGAGQGASLSELELIDPSASIFNSPDELIALFGGAQGGGTGGSTFSEPGLAGVTIYLDLNDNGVLDSGEPTTVTATDNPNTTANETGTYSFSNLSTGLYTVREVVPTGLYQTFPSQNGGHSVNLGLRYRSLANDIDFGNAPPGEITGTKYYDTNENGILDFGDQTLSGVTIYIDLDLNGLRDPDEPSQVTDNSGNYSFGFFAPGQYTVREEVNGFCNWVQTSPQGGHTVQLAGGMTARNLNFLNYLDNYAWTLNTTLYICTPDSHDLVGVYQTNTTISVQVNDQFYQFDTTVIDLVDVDTAGGDDQITIQGGYVDTDLDGGWGDDVITSSWGFDTLWGGPGDDTLIGGPGTDVYVMHDVNPVAELDTIVEYANSGFDLLDFRYSPVGVAVDLSSNQIATQGLRTIVAGPNTVPSLEGVAGTQQSDTLVGNTLNNSLWGYGGSDTLTGAGGDDTLTGGLGADVYLFDADTPLGTDVVSEIFGEGSDTLDFSATTTVSINLQMARVTTQVINPALSLTITTGAIENSIGGALDDTIVGTVAPNIIRGNGGNDTLTGGGASDTLVGGTGDDRYLFDADAALGTDTIDETAGGLDTLDFSATTTNSVAVNLSTATSQIVNGFSSLILGSSTAIENIVGGGLADTLTGNTLANVLEGGGGSDLLIGAAGNDTYVFDTDVALGIDTIDESAGGIETLDFSRTTSKSIAVSLANAATQIVNSNLSLVLSSSTTIENIVGGSLGDTLTGNTLANTLTGGPGDDSLNGGAANDVYLFDTDSALGVDTIDEPAGGIDTLDFGATTTKSVSVNLGVTTAQVVNSSLSLILVNSTAIEGAVGGALGDNLIGSAIANRLSGGAGDDSLNGGVGDDVYLFDTDTALGTDTINETAGGSDTLDFSSSTTRAVAVNLGQSTIQTINAGLKLVLGSATTLENIVGSSLADILNGNSLANKLTGGPGDDLLNGSTGNDMYVFDADAALGADSINESAGGVDTLDYSLTTTKSVALNLATASSQIVNSNHRLVLSSGTDIENAIGGGLADTLIGNTQANMFTGNGGDDTLRGAAGNDVYVFDTDVALGTDTIDEAGGGIDTLDFSATTLRSVNVNLGLATSQAVNAGLSLILSSTSTIENVMGGALGDTLRGNTLDNRLTGASGDDTLIGLTGNDTYAFDTDLVLGADTIDESAGGIDTLDFSETTTKTVNVRLSTSTLQNVSGQLKLTLSSVNTIENAIGGSLADALVGNALNNVLNGGDGDDRLEGFGGNDTLIGGLGNDTYRFDADAASGTDTIDESAGGNDTLDFAATSAGLTVNLALATAQVLNASLSLVLSSSDAIENVIGGTGADTITGNSANNVLTGNSGIDTITGADGRDVLIGGLGTDTINGGAGEDILIGGNSSHEANIVALREIMTEWARTDQTYAQRVAHLNTASGGLNGTTLFNNASISNDANTADQLTGAANVDWFFASQGDNLLDIVLASETRINI